MRRSGDTRSRWALAGLLSLTLAFLAAGQDPGKTAAGQKNPAPSKADLSPTPPKVDVVPLAGDEEIRRRLTSVLEATGWFTDPQVRVTDGVVFLSGSTSSEELKAWAGQLASKTQDVAAVANRIEVTEPSPWDFEEGWRGLSGLWRGFMRSLPLFLLGLLILALSGVAGTMATRGMRIALRKRIRSRLLRGVLARAVGVGIFVIGAYIVLRVSGLTQLALTVIGGTGLIGLVLGIAFRDITENFLASIFLSIQRPFETGDLVEIAGVTGSVQQLNVRTTILMTTDGNLFQVPNAMVYKSTLRNFTANPNRRESFVVGIGYDDHIDEAQEIAREVLNEHPAVLKEPEPMVLADSLGPATVNLRVYFWLNGREHSWLKVKSSVIRLVKLAFQRHGISMPDEAREVVFPRGVPVTIIEHEAAKMQTRDEIAGAGASSASRQTEAVSTKAEAGLHNEDEALEEQARRAAPLDEGENLLDKPSD
jgi:small-conductance mechanosensitive channel